MAEWQDSLPPSGPHSLVIFFFRLFLAAALLLAVLPAQDAPDLPRRNGQRRGGGLELPQNDFPSTQDGEQNAQAATEVERPALWADASKPAELVFLNFELSRDISEHLRGKALDELLLLGLGTRSTALTALHSNWMPTVLLGAELLMSVGIDEDANALIEAASRLPQIETVTSCLDSSIRLQGGYLPKLAINLLEHPRKPVRAAIESRVKRNPHESHTNVLMKHLRFGRDQDVRLRAVRLLAFSLEQDGIREALRQVLESAKPALAFAVVDALTGTALPKEVDALLADVQSVEPSTEMSYLLFGLLKQQSYLNKNLMTPELIEHVRPGLDHGDIFLSGSSAVALAEWAYRSSTTTPDTSLDSTIVHRLVRAVDGDEFYPQYSRFSAFAEASLRRVTGEDFPKQAKSAWLSWWLEHGDNFRMVRGRLILEEASLPKMALRWSQEGQSYALFGQQAQLREGESGRWLPPTSLLGVQTLLHDSGFLSEDIRSGTYGSATSAISLEFELELGVRRKCIKYRGAYPDYLQTMLADLRSLYAQQEWQILAGTDGFDFVKEHLSELPSEMESRDQWANSMSQGRLAKLSAEELRSWIGFLNQSKSPLVAFTDEHQVEWLDALDSHAEYPELAFDILRFYLSTPESHTDMLLERLAQFDEPLRSKLVFEAMQQTDVSVVTASLVSGETYVRVLAAQALATKGVKAQPALLLALNDESQTVVQVALRSLGAMQNPAHADSFSILAAPEMPDATRCEALWALGELDLPTVPTTLTEGLGASSPSVRAAAMAAIGAMSSSEAKATFAALFTRYQGTSLESLYLQSLYQTGAEHTRKVLRDYLGDDDAQVVHRALFSLAPLGDPAAASLLMDRLAKEPNDQATLDALAATLCVDFRSFPDPAGVYQAWWPDNFLLDSSAWLVRGAGDAGFVLQEDMLNASVVPIKEAARDLLAVLQKGPAHLRGAASYQLHRLTGIGGPVVLPLMPSALVVQRTQAWQAWIDEQPEL